jgi:hypothetical protein
VTLPLTPSVALPALGFTGFDSPPREEVPGPSPLAASSKATRFLGPERLVCDQFDPRAQPRMTLNLGDFVMSSEVLASSNIVTSGVTILAVATPTELPRFRTRSAFAAQATRHDDDL